MNTYSFLPSPALEKSLNALAFVSFTENYMDYIARMGWYPIDTTNILDSNIQMQIDQINAQCAQTHARAVAHAKAWSAGNKQPKGIREQVGDVANALKTFAEEWTSTADGTETDAQRLEILSAQVSAINKQFAPIQSNVDAFAKAIATDRENFELEYAAQKKLAQKLSTFYDQLESTIKALQTELDKTNDEIIQKTIETAIDDVKDGILAISSAAEEDWVETGKEVVTMTYVTFKYELEGIKLEEKAIKLLHQIIALTKEAEVVEVALLRLRDLGTQLHTIGNRGVNFAQVVDTSAAFFSTMQTYLNEIANGTAKAGSWPDTIAPWNAFQAKLERIQNRPNNGSIELWNANKL